MLEVPKVQHPIYHYSGILGVALSIIWRTMSSANHRRRQVDDMDERVAHPGESLRVKLEERGWTQNDLATIMGRPVRLVTEIVTGKRSITPETAVELGPRSERQPSGGWTRSSHIVYQKSAK